MSIYTDPDEETLSFSENWGQILDQDVFWIEASGQRLLLDEMDPQRCTNVRNWIFRNLSRLAERDLWRMASSPGPSGDVACDAFDSEMAQLEHIVANAPAWAAGTPLCEALERRSRGLRAKGEETAMEGGARTYSRIPKDVLAVRYDGTNSIDITVVINNKAIGVEETMVSGPGRGMQKALVIRTHRWSVVVVPVGSWLLIDDDSDGTFHSMSHEQFTADYREKF